MTVDQVGVIIESGPSDWQIIQQDGDGFGQFHISGRWVGEPSGQVQVRLVAEDSTSPVNRELDWHSVDTGADGTWSTTTQRIPAGGLYRLETRYNLNNTCEWAPRGDMRHFLGVGDLWIIAGQSNSAGYGRGPVLDPPELGIHLYRNSETWALAAHPLNESTDTRHPVNRETANSAHSPYLQFAKILKQQLGYPIGLIQTSLGGSPLTSWNPTEPGPAGLYDNMVRCAEKTGGAVKGVVWYQGESDASGEAAESYEERFINAVGAWRQALHNPDLGVVTVQLNRVYMPADEAADQGWTRVREAQRQVARRLPGVSVVPTFDLALSDAIHTNPAGNMVLGERMARAALRVNYGKVGDGSAPDLTSATLRDGNVIELLFDGVTGRLDTVQHYAHSFRVEDGAGVVPIAEVEYPQDARIFLKTGRTIEGQAVVHGAYGINPAIVPFDVERQMPMLGFYGVKVAGV